jgi:hypothetical protein
MVTYKSISKELRLLIIEKQSNAKTEKESNKAINDAREEINKKYGKEWRDLKQHHNLPSIKDLSDYEYWKP